MLTGNDDMLESCAVEEEAIVRERVQEVRVWGHDCRPPHDHKLQQAVDTIAVLSDALHAPED